MTGTLTERLTSDWVAMTTSGVLFPTYPEEGPGSSEPPLQESRRRTTSWVNFVLPVPDEKMSWRNTKIAVSEIAEGFVPRTPLGKQLLSLRNKAIRSGMKLLSADEVLEEVKRRRGELEDDEADLY